VTDNIRPETDPSYSLDESMLDGDGNEVYYTRVVPTWNVAAGPEDRNLADLDAKREG
jgi:hypothetical protein